MSRYLGYGYRGRTGLECSLAYGPDIEWIKFGIYSSSPAGRLICNVRLTPASGELAHGDDTVGWTPFANVGVLGGNIWEWRNAKLVVDLATGFFDKFVFMGTVYDMSAIAGRALVAATPYRWHVWIENDSSTADQYTLHLDNVILTIDEP